MNRIHKIILAMLLAVFVNPIFAASVILQNVHYVESQSQLFIKGKLSEKMDGAIVRASNAETGEQLGTSIVQKNQFQLRISEDTISGIPCALRVEIDGAESTGPVSLNGAKCGIYTVTISGLVTDAPIPYAVITVTVGGQTYSTIADADGAYSLDIATTNPNQLVTINATDDEVVDFYSIVGTFTELIESTGGGTSTGSSNNPNLNVTNVSTAKYSLILEANDGNPPTTEDQLRDAEGSVDATELLERAAIIKLIVDDPDYSLPAGVDNVFELLADATLYDAYVEEVNTNDPAALETAILTILADTDLTPGFTIADIPSVFYSIPSAAPGFMARGGETLEFDLPYIEGAVNTGLLLTSNQGNPISQTFTWLLDTGKLIVNFDTPISFDNFTEIEETTATLNQMNLWHDLGYQSLNVTSTFDRRTYFLISSGSQTEFVSVEFPSVETYDTGFVDPVDAVALGLPLSDLSTTVVDQEQLWNGDDLNPIPFTVDKVVGQWAMNIYYDNGINIFSGQPFGEIIATDLVTFSSNGTATAQKSGLSFNWSINAVGELVVVYSTGMVETITTLEQQGPLNGFIYGFVDSNSNRFASYNFGIKKDQTFVLTESYMQNMADQFWFAMVNAWNPRIYDSNGNIFTNNYWGWEIGASGFMLNSSFYSQNIINDGSADAVWSREMVWEITAGNTIRFEGPWWGHCYFSTVPSENCVYREWTPLAQVDNGGPDGTAKLFYAIEAATAGANFGSLDPTGVNNVTYFPSRINIYQETPKPPVTLNDTWSIQ